MHGWLSAGETRERLGVSYERVTQLRLAGRLRAYRTRAGWMYDPASVEEYLRQREAWLAKRQRPADGGCQG